MMRGFAGYLMIGVLGVLSMGVVTIAGLGIEVSARPVAEGGAIIQHVDRVLKGDRLDIHRAYGVRPVMKRDLGRVPVGCDPVFSPLSSSARSNYPGRCIT